MTKILVTGASGLIGRQVTSDLVAKNFDVYSCYHIERPEFGIETQLNLTKWENITYVLQSIKPDMVIHLAAITDVDMCQTQKELAYLVNTKATEILAVESSKHNSFFVYLSTDYVFDGKNSMRSETDIPNPVNFYGRSKLDGEIALSNSVSSYSIIRTSTPFGLHTKKKSFPLWVKENLESKKEIPVLVDQFTSPTFVPNLSKMLIEVTIKQISGTIHLAGSTRISRYEFAKIIANKFCLDDSFLKPTKISEMKWIAQRPQDSSLNISKAIQILDNKPQTIESSLEDFLNQIKNLN
jgi:dTDP-4-dehydrorhamnose reductase